MNPFTRLDLMRYLKDHVALYRNRHVLVNLSLYLQPAPGVVLKVTPDNEGYVDHYSALRVDIFSRWNKLDTVFISFESLRSSVLNPRPDYDGPLFIWRNNGKEDWYILRPESLEPLPLQLDALALFWAAQTTT
jgi:hypothetical protein